MKNYHQLVLFRIVFIFVFLLSFTILSAQDISQSNSTPSDFWSKVQYGGGFGFGFSSRDSNVLVAPSAIYNFNPVVALGTGVSFNYISARNTFSTTIYGLSGIVLVNPIPQVQFSITITESRVNYQDKVFSNFSENYWDTGLMVGLGYRTGNITFGLNYNVLTNDRYDRDAFVPFIRAYF